MDAITSMEEFGPLGPVEVQLVVIRWPRDDHVESLLTTGGLALMVMNNLEIVDELLSYSWESLRIRVGGMKWFRI
jgi:hypothetical protein